MKRILVTGSNGQLGQCIQKIAREYNDLDFHFFASKHYFVINIYIQ